MPRTFTSQPFIAALTIVGVTFFGTSLWAATNYVDAAESLVIGRGRYTSQGERALQICQVSQRLKAIDEQVDELQQKELSDYFNDLFSVRLNPGEAIDFSKTTSRENLRRLNSEDSHVQSSFEFKLAKQAIDRDTQLILHNGAGFAFLQKSKFLLSSRELKLMGLEAGAQNLAPFNYRFLNTSNWLFFFIDSAQDATRYGRESVFLDPSYASEHGLIFPFVMDPWDLVAQGVLTAPEIGKEYLERLEKNYPRTVARLHLLETVQKRTFSKSERAVWLTTHIFDEGTITLSQFLDEQNDVLKIFRKSLGRYMFTLDDYRLFAATQVAAYLIRLKQKNFIDYTKNMLRLSWPSLWENQNMTRFLIAEAFKNAGLPSRYELRIPEAIPVLKLMDPCERTLISRQTISE